MKRVVIVGCAARSIEWPEDAQVWVINQAGRMYIDPPISYQPVFGADPSCVRAGLPTRLVRPRWHRWYHLHGPEHIRTKDGPNALADVRLAAETAAMLGIRVIMPKAYYPGVEAFPYDALTARFGQQVGRYLTSSVAILPALAIIEGFEEIILDGMQYGQDEPSEAWAVRCVEFWLGVAVGCGIKVTVPPGQGIMECDHVYGLEGPGCV